VNPAALQGLLPGLLPGLLLALPVWLASVWRRDASLVDRFWPWLVLAPALHGALNAAALDARGVAMLLLGLLWAARLSLFISWRNWGQGEDRRYAAIRARNQPGFALKSLYLVFGLQAVLASIVALPLLAGVAGMGPWSAVNTLGLLLALLGIVCEALADAQLARFRAARANAGRVMAQGLWRYSRHPNYFGEACVWWGLWLMAPAPWALASPLLMSWLLLRISGVALLEQDIAERRPEYLRYRATTNAFFPGPPRKVPR
jgi:steroid 5-alpha reductase family enzyme